MLFHYEFTKLEFFIFSSKYFIFSQMKIIYTSLIYLAIANPNMSASRLVLSFLYIVSYSFHQKKTLPDIVHFDIVTTCYLLKFNWCESSERNFFHIIFFIVHSCAVRAAHILH